MDLEALWSLDQFCYARDLREWEGGKPECRKHVRLSRRADGGEGKVSGGGGARKECVGAPTEQTNQGEEESDGIKP
jgi:hypothetical protein